MLRADRKPISIRLEDNITTSGTIHNTNNQTTYLLIRAI